MKRHIAVEMKNSTSTACVQSTDPDVRATAARIKQFVMEHAYRDPPEGSQLPEYDQSADLAC